MRTISYICNGCGKPLTFRSAIKINMNLQRGVHPLEKNTLDFCSSCFLKVKSVFLEGTIPEISTDTKERKTAEVTEKIRKTEQPVSSEKTADRSKLITGLISPDERQEILRLYVQEGLDADQIAAKLNRLPRGIKRTIHTAEKTGKLKQMQDAKISVSGLKPSDEKKVSDLAGSLASQLMVSEEEVTERNQGSGTSNAAILRDSYTTAPQTEVIQGRRYDVGGVLALAKAGWPVDKIAEERHYDEDVVMIILEKYLH